MVNSSLEETVKEIDAAFNRGDVEAVLVFYEDGAAVVLEPGRLARGKDEIRRAFRGLLGMGGVAAQIKTNVIEAGDIALFTSKWSFSGKAPDGTPFTRESFATSVFRKHRDGRWRCVIDNSYGPAILV
ncbi:MAG: YybH family protein [Blastocatellia bacterium]